LIVHSQKTTLQFDELAESHPNRWLCKEAKFKAREARGVRRTSSTPQRQRAEAQRRNWTIYKAIKIDLLDFQRRVNWNFRSQKFLTSHIWDGMGHLPIKIYPLDLNEYSSFSAAMIVFAAGCHTARRR
jgi:hypothetical protein